MCQRKVKLGYGWPHVSTSGSGMVPSKLRKTIEPHGPGENDDRPCMFSKRFGWTKSFGTYRMEMINENKLAKGCRSRRGVKGRLSWVMAGHMSAPLGLEWLPPSFRNSLKHFDLGKMMIDPAFFSKRFGWTKSFGTYRMEMLNENKLAKGCRSRRGVKGRLSWVMAGHMSAPLGLEWFPPSLEKQLNRIDLGKMMIDPAFFSKRLGWTKSVGI